MKKVLTTLQNSEKQKDINTQKDIHILASILPKDNIYELTPKHKDLILLSRVLNNGLIDVCTAVSFDKDSSVQLTNKAVLLVTNNERNGDYNINYLKKLQLYISSPFKDNYDALEEQAQECANNILTYDKTEVRISKLTRQEQDYFASVDSLIELAQNGFFDISDDAWKLAIEIIQPVIDTRDIVNKIAIGDLNKDIVIAISEGRFEFVEGIEGVHAEMQLTKELEERQVIVSGERPTIEMGISKLYCCMCSVTVDLIRAQGIDFVDMGTSGGTYPAAREPRLTIVSDQEILVKLQGLIGLEKHSKGRETTFEYNGMLYKEDNQLYAFTSVDDLTNQRSTLVTKIARTHQLIIEKESELEELNDEFKKIFKNKNSAYQINKRELKKQRKIESDITQKQKIVSFQQERSEERSRQLQDLENQLEQAKADWDKAESEFLGGREVEYLKSRSRMEYKNLQSEHGAKIGGIESRIKKLMPTANQYVETKTNIVNNDDPDRLQTLTNKQNALEQDKIDFKKQMMAKTKELKTLDLQKSEFIGELEAVNSTIEFYNTINEVYCLWEDIENDNQHLKRTGKSILSQDGQSYDMRGAFAAENVNSELLNHLEKESIIAASADASLKAINTGQNVENSKIGVVEFKGEKHHGRDHAANVGSLIDRLKSGDISKDTVIAIELKQYGENLGMSDVIMLASILEHNKKNLDNQLKIPEEITRDSLIYHDALLYNVAKEEGVKVIGLEGKGLHTSDDKAKENYKGSDQYNEKREEHMAGVINELADKGYNVIAHVGSSHVELLKKLTERIKSNRSPKAIQTAAKYDITENFSKQDKEALSFIVSTMKPTIAKVHSKIGEHHMSKHLKHRPKSTDTGVKR